MSVRDSSVRNPTEAAALGDLPSRPRAPALHRNLQRAGFQWIFRRLRATDTQLNWIAAGQFSELLGDLRPRVEQGDAQATVVFGWIAERCRLLRNSEAQASWRQFNSAKLQQLTPTDRVDYQDVAALEDQWERAFRSTCASQIDQDDVDKRLEDMAAKQDGASLWLLSRRSGNYAEGLKLMSQAAEAGFAQAQYEFARDLLEARGVHQVITDAPSPSELLTEAAATVPEAKVVLAQCLLDGCDGKQPDHEAALALAREAAAEGQPDAMLLMGSRLSVGSLPPDEVSAWKLFKATLAAQGCFGDEDAAFGLEQRRASSPVPLPSSAARTLAVTFWRQYGAHAEMVLGCGS
jgi:TPR repeat protein